MLTPIELAMSSNDAKVAASLGTFHPSMVSKITRLRREKIIHRS